MDMRAVGTIVGLKSSLENLANSPASSCILFVPVAGKSDMPNTLELTGPEDFPRYERIRCSRAAMTPLEIGWLAVGCSIGVISLG